MTASSAGRLPSFGTNLIPEPQDVITGTAGDDVLLGTAGADTMIGLTGNDTYRADPSDTIIELDGEGIDKVDATGTFSLASVAFVENLEINSDTPTIGTGNNLNNEILGSSVSDTLIGGGGDDFLNGRSGVDTLIGGVGNDSYFIINAQDIIAENSNEGIDTVIVGASNTFFSFSIAGLANVENLTFQSSIAPHPGIVATGNSLNNTISVATTTANLNDTLDGGAGDDTLIGSYGNDTYIVDSLGDIIVELNTFSFDGIDTIRTALSAYSLGSANVGVVENLVFTGVGDFVGTGNALINSITGGAGDDTLMGGDGADTLNGGTGGADWVDFSDSLLFGVNANLLLGFAAGGAGGDTLIGIDNLRGSPLADMLVGNSAANTLDGAAGDDRLIGVGGADVLIGGDGDDWADYVASSSSGVSVNLALGTGAGGDAQGDTLTGIENLRGSNFDDFLTGDAGANTLDGGAEADTLDGGLGADVLIGWFGDDVYVVDNAFDITSEPVGGGTDIVRSSVTWFQFDEVEDLTLTGVAAINGSGNALANVITGNDAANQMFGLAGNDTLEGGAGADALDGGLGLDTASYDGAGAGVTVDLAAPTSNTGDAVGDTYASIEVFEGSGHADALRGDDSANVLSGAGGDDTLEGRLGDDTLRGSAGADFLDGGAGADVLIGGAGDDTFVVDNEFDITTELAGEGTDSVQSSISWFLFDEVENLTLTGAAAINGSGNSLANVIIGNGAANSLFGQGGNDTLDGGAGADQMFGGLGDDLYIVDNGGDLTFEGNVAWGTDLVQASVSYQLGQNIDNLTLVGAALVGNGNLLANVITGNANANTLFGMAGNDTLNGAAGADQMFGGLGDDLYIVDDAADFTFEAQSAWGIDTVQTNVSYQLGQNIDNLVLQAGAGALTGRGNLLNNVITGNESANTLFGFAGNDTLDGGLDADQLYGREGDDAYVVDNVSDVVAEANAAWGTDTIFASVTYFLSPNIENLTLTGAGNINGNGNVLNNTLTGNAGANNLFGQSGNDTLDGGGGADSMFGGEGDDTYIVDNAGDVGFEGNVAWGIDVVQTSVSHILGTNLDNLTLTGAAAINATGNGLANVINGNSGANQLFGLGGGDTLSGDAGNDALDGGAGDDAFVFSPGSGSDTVSGFVAGGADDTIDLFAYNGSGVTWSINQVGADTVFSFTNGDQITLIGVTAASLVQTDPFGYS